MELQACPRLGQLILLIKKQNIKRNINLFKLFLLGTICLLLLLLITINCYYIKHRLKEETCYHFSNIKVVTNNELKEIDIKNGTSYYFNDMIKNNDFDLGTNLLDEKLYKNILTYHAAYKTPYNEKPYLLFLIKQVEI